MKNYLYSVVFFILLFVPTVFLYAQQDQEAIADAPADPVDTPIDGGLLALLAVGAGYGARKYSLQKRNEDES